MASSKKVLILGANGVGKSYILNRLLNKTNYFQSSSDPCPTTKTISSGDSSFEIESGNMNLFAFDTPGEHIFKFFSKSKAFFKSLKSKILKASLMQTTLDKPLTQLCLN